MRPRKNTDNLRSLIPVRVAIHERSIHRHPEVKPDQDQHGRALDNVFVERLWRDVKQEEVYLKGYRNIPECREGLSHYFDRYNTLREHQSLDYNTPAEIYKGEIELKKAA